MLLVGANSTDLVGRRGGCDRVDVPRASVDWGRAVTHQSTGTVYACITGVDAIHPFRPTEFEQTFFRHGGVGDTKSWLRSLGVSMHTRLVLSPGQVSLLPFSM